MIGMDGLLEDFQRNPRVSKDVQPNHVACPKSGTNEQSKNGLFVKQPPSHQE